MLERQFIFPSLLQPLIRKSLECRDLVDEAKKFHLRPDLRAQISLSSERCKPRTGAFLDVIMIESL